MTAVLQYVLEVLMEKRLFTSESVTEGHPDKICDIIADAILDEIMTQDPYGRVACEACVTTNYVLVFGEVSTTAVVDYERVVRDVIKEIGYTDETIGFDSESCTVEIRLKKQSPDIAQGVDKAQDDDSNGAGDQGMMFGYASNETDTFMPMPVYLAHKLAKRLAWLRKSGTLPYLRPDGKTQITLEYDDAGRPFRVDAVVCSTQHSPDVTQEQIHEDIKKYLISEIIPAEMLDAGTRYYINPTGRFIIGGPNGDAGLSGRKIIIDTYGGMGRHGGGAFSGKDCTKVDRSAAYAARYIAKNIAAAGLADKCEIQIAYAIGVAMPMSIRVDTFGTGKLPDQKITEIVRENFDLRPSGIIKMLDLRRPIYKQTAAYGHFGKDDAELPWENTDKAEILRRYL